MEVGDFFGEIGNKGGACTDLDEENKPVKILSRLEFVCRYSLGEGMEESGY